MDQKKPYSHFVTRFRLSGDIERAKLLIKTGERQMGMLRSQLGYQDLLQGYREFEPFSGARINCSIVGSVRLIEIYVHPVIPVEKELEVERPCFCNCCFAECQIVKVDGTWRDNNHYDIPLPDLGYKHGDRRLRYDIDVCSFLGISPESGLLTYEFYRVENVMPSDFTPYEVGDWAMVYFTDLARETECGKCADCDPPLNDELGQVWGCIPRDVAEALNSPQCIILPIAIDDRISRDTVYFRPLESMRLGTCIKKGVVDWVQYSWINNQGNIEGGYANVAWSDWVQSPAAVVNFVPIRYCTQDFTNLHGSHAFRPADWVYVFIEGDQFTVIGIHTDELWSYQERGVTCKTVCPAIILIQVAAQEERFQYSTYDNQYWGYFTHEPGTLAPEVAQDPLFIPGKLVWLIDYTHDTLFSFKRYSWREDELVYPASQEDVTRLANTYLNTARGANPLNVYHTSQSAFTTELLPYARFSVEDDWDPVVTSNVSVEAGHQTNVWPLTGEHYDLPLFQHVGSEWSVSGGPSASWYDGSLRMSGAVGSLYYNCRVKPGLYSASASLTDGGYGYETEQSLVLEHEARSATSIDDRWSDDGTEVDLYPYPATTYRCRGVVQRSTVSESRGTDHLTTWTTSPLVFYYWNTVTGSLSMTTTYQYDSFFFNSEAIPVAQLMTGNHSVTESLTYNTNSSAGVTTNNNTLVYSSVVSAGRFTMGIRMFSSLSVRFVSGVYEQLNFNVSTSRSYYQGNPDQREASNPLQNVAYGVTSFGMSKFPRYTDGSMNVTLDPGYYDDNSQYWTKRNGEQRLITAEIVNLSSRHDDPILSSALGGAVTSIVNKPGISLILENIAQSVPWRHQEWRDGVMGGTIDYSRFIIDPGVGAPELRIRAYPTYEHALFSEDILEIVFLK